MQMLWKGSMCKFSLIFMLQAGVLSWMLGLQNFTCQAFKRRHQGQDIKRDEQKVNGGKLDEAGRIFCYQDVLEREARVEKMVRVAAVWLKWKEGGRWLVCPWITTSL